MEIVKRHTMRALYRLACIMSGYIGQEINRLIIIAVVSIPTCYIFLYLGVVLSV